MAGTVLSAMFVSSCSSDDDPVPAPYEPKANTVSFVEEPGTAVLAVDADEFEVTVVRTHISIFFNLFRFYKVYYN